MSAYDNPTIIKDNSGMILAQGVSSFGESFAKAQATRDAKLLEQKKELDKQRKEADELILQQQSIKLQNDIYNNKQTSNTLSTISKTDTELQRQIGSSLARDYDRSGNYAMEVATTPQSAERLKEISKFNQDLEVGKDNAVKMAGGLLANQTEYDAMGSDATTSLVWNGIDELEKFSNQVTFFAMNPKNLSYAGKIEKNYTSDENNPSLAKLNLKTNIGNESEAINSFKNYFPKDTPPEKIKEALDKGISDGKITKNDKGDFIINFEKPVGQGWDYSFYRKIPKATQGTELDKDHANILNEKDGGILDKFLYNNGIPKFDDVQVSSGLSKNKKTAYTETIYANIDAIKQASAQYYNFNIQGLMQSDFKDIAVLNGFLQNKLKLPKMNAAELARLYPDEKDQVNFMANAAMDLDLQNRLTSASAGGGKTWIRRNATKADIDAGRAKTLTDDVYESKSAPVVYAKDVPADNRLTPGQELNQKNLMANEKIVQAWANKGDADKSSIISADGSTNLSWDNKTQTWVPSFKNPSNGSFEGGTNQTGYATKAEAMRNYFRK